MKRKLLLNIILGTVFFGTTRGQIVTDRPDQTESAMTVPRGALQIEGGLLWERQGEAQPAIDQYLLPTLLFRYGINSGVELRVLTQYELNEIGDLSTRGLSAMEIGAKIKLHKGENGVTDIAYLPGLIIPTGSIEISGDALGTSHKLSVSHTLSQTMGLGYNIGYIYPGEGNSSIIYSLSLGIKVNDKLAIYAEPYGNVEDLKRFVSNFDSGVTYLAKENLQFDFSFGAGINQKMHYIALGCSWLVSITQ